MVTHKRECRSRAAELYRDEVAHEDSGKGQDGTSLMATLVRVSKDPATAPEDRFTDHQLAYLAGGMLDGAVDSTYSMTHSMIKAMVAHPAVLAKAREEVDAAWRTTELPETPDVNKLPYLKACLSEVSSHYCSPTQVDEWMGD